MFKEILEYIWQKRNWWLIPPAIMLIIFALLLIFSTTSPLSPFVYMLF